MVDAGQRPKSCGNKWRNVRHDELQERMLLKAFISQNDFSSLSIAS